MSRGEIVAVTKEAEMLGERVRELRDKARMTQEKLAQAADLTTSFVSTVERGQKMPSLNTILKLARGLRIDAGELLSGFNFDALRRMKL
jgi:transcriptional regulator with XRE-family HTH domain